MSTVVPGEELGVIEEYLPGDNVYVDDGKIRSLIVGIVNRDTIRHVVSVSPIRPSMLITPNSVIYGRVVSIPSERVAVVRITALARNPIVKLRNTITGVLPVTQAVGFRVGSVEELVGVGDVVKAKVLSKTPPYALTIREGDLGVVYSICPRCGSTMRRRGLDRLICPNCGSQSRRKLSMSEYWG